jgi:hypothetical protein
MRRRYSLDFTRRKPFDVLAERALFKDGRGDWRSFEPCPRTIAAYISCFSGPAVPSLAIAERILRRSA